MVLAIGGRSKIGTALIENLLGKGESVRALARSGESADAFGAGVEVVTGDLADRASLDAAMRGADKVFLLCGPTPDEVQFNRNAIDAAKAAGVSLLVRSSIIGSDPASAATFVRDHGACDEYLRASGVPHAIVRPNLFLQNVPEQTVPALDENGNFYVNAADARISMVDTRDVGALAAVLLTEPGHEGEEWDVTGPQALSYLDVGSTLSRTLGRQVNYVDVPDDAVRSALSGFGLGDWMVGAVVDLYQDYRRSGTDGYAAQVTDSVERLTGTPASTLEQVLAN